MNASSLSGLCASEIFIARHPRAPACGAPRGAPPGRAPTPPSGRVTSATRRSSRAARAQRAPRAPRARARASRRGPVHHDRVGARDQRVAGRPSSARASRNGCATNEQQVGRGHVHDRRSLHHHQPRPASDATPRPGRPHRRRAAIAQTTRRAPACAQPGGVGARLVQHARRPPRSGTARRCRTPRRACRAGSARTRPRWS